MFNKFLALLMVTLVLAVLTVYYRVEAVREGYRIGRLIEEREAVRQEAQRLACELETLRSPPVLAARARALGHDLVPPPPLDDPLQR